MKTAFISDVHGNLEALTAVTQSLRDEGVSRVLFLGDIVGYGANPGECIEIVREIADTILAGNHDWAAVDKTDTSSFNAAAQAAVAWTKSVLTAADKAFLSQLSLNEETKDFFCVHATPLHPEAWGYIVNDRDASQSFAHFSESLCFVAHSHYPTVFILTDKNRINSERTAHLSIRAGCRYIINSGSVGQPRDGNPAASYGIYDTDKKEYRLLRVEYDIALAQKKILDAGLPPFLAHRLALGR